MSGSYPAAPAPSPAPGEPDPGERRALALALGAALLGVAAGILVIARPEPTITVAVFLFGSLLLAFGIIRIAQAIAGGGRRAGQRAVAGATGILGIAAGVLVVRDHPTSLTLVTTVLGLTWLVAG